MGPRPLKHLVLWFCSQSFTTYSPTTRSNITTHLITIPQSIMTGKRPGGGCQWVSYTVAERWQLNKPEALQINFRQHCLYSSPLLFQRASDSNSAGCLWLDDHYQSLNLIGQSHPSDYSAVILFTTLHKSPSLIIIITWHRWFDKYAATFTQWWRQLHNCWNVWNPLAPPASGHQVIMTDLPIYIHIATQAFTNHSS